MGPFCVCENKWDMFPDIVHCVEKKILQLQQKCQMSVHYSFDSFFVI